MNDDAALMASFCSIGLSCEFGVAQCMYGADPIDLLRWAWTPMPLLLEMLEHRFAGIGDDLQVSLPAPGGQYFVGSPRYAFRWHAWVKDGEMAPDQILARERVRLPRLADKMMECIVEGQRIFVRTTDWNGSEDGLPDLLGALRRCGPATLLFVARADATHPAGTVMRISDGLLRGYIDHFADPTMVPATTAAPDWLALCREARALMPV
jgi:hypothetical protein